MPNPDLQLYGVHGTFWTAFGLTLVILRILYGREKYVGRSFQGRHESPAPVPVAREAHTAGHSRALVAFHGAAFGVMYFGIATAVFGRRVPAWFDGQRTAGTIVIAIGTALMVSTLVHFRSWRFRATLDQGHQLATGGPFRILRHPIYMALNLLALGSAIWVPTPIMWIAFLLMAIGGDLRGRAEERILEDAFGDAYRDYCGRTRRFVPYVY
jgi:protein-S-isoprenylcysteine O-methyltransferase Ste14